jgi:hypothetical protein
MCGPQQTRWADEAIAALAEVQHGVVSRAQLLSAGVTARQIEWRLRRKRLHRVHLGVYAVGHRALSHLGLWMAAVLAAGEGAVLSHWSAASLWRMRPGRGPRSHVTSPRERRNRPSITFHFSALPPDEITIEQGIPVTTPARTQLDLAPLLPSPTLARMIDAAGTCAGTTLATLCERYPGRAGVPKLTKIVASSRPMTRSDLEAELLDAMERAGLPRPLVNAVVEGFEADFAWPQHGVIAELDTYVTHGSPLAFERDRERDRKLTAAGWRVVRMTDRRPAEALADLRKLLAASAARSPGRRAAA